MRQVEQQRVVVRVLLRRPPCQLDLPDRAELLAGNEFAQAHAGRRVAQHQARLREQVLCVGEACKPLRLLGGGRGGHLCPEMAAVLQRDRGGLCVQLRRPADQHRVKVHLVDHRADVLVGAEGPEAT